MTDPEATPFELLWKQEEFRQVKESFDAWKRERTLWMVARAATLTISIILLPVICAVCTWIVFHSKDFSGETALAAASALVVEVLGLLLATYRTLVGKPPQPLQPVLGRYTTFHESSGPEVEAPTGKNGTPAGISSDAPLESAEAPAAPGE